MMQNEKLTEKLFKKNKTTLRSLELFVDKMKDECFFVVFGGFAIDAYHGSLTRFHEDIDMICWRKDIKKIRSILLKLNFKAKLFKHPTDSTLIYKMSTTDKDKLISFQIADRIDKNNFEISFWPYAHVKFPNKYISENNWIELEGVRFPAVHRKMLIKLKEKQVKLYEKTRKKEPERFLFKQEHKYEKALHDLELLKASKD